MPQLDARSLPVGRRRRGRPTGSDSAETRNRILRAARQVISERGYHAATFQAIAAAADLSRPTLHCYFDSREQIYAMLVDEAGDVMAECIDAARRKNSLIEQLTTLFSGMLEVDRLDRSRLAFLVSARLESTRNPILALGASSALLSFLESLLADAKSRGELAADTLVTPIADMLHAMLWGVGLHAGFIDTPSGLGSITKQLSLLLSHGLLNGDGEPTNHSDTFRDTPRAV
ncbi:MAG: transcriptional regulator, TetR family [Mycobacterium sp.]|nr:transcriptional regulator, TetR family [Mycobacterium sp.]